MGPGSPSLRSGARDDSGEIRGDERGWVCAWKEKPTLCWPLSLIRARDSPVVPFFFPPPVEEFHNDSRCEKASDVSIC